MWRLLSVALGLLWGCTSTETAFRPAAKVRALGAPAPSWERLASQVTIHRDEWGVPHVFGPTDASVVLGYAFARAEDEFERMERAVFVMLGRNAEILGEAGLTWDRLVHAFEVPGRSRAEYAQLRPELRALADAWAEGINLYAEGRSAARLVERFEPWHLIAQGYALHLHAAALELRRLDPSLVPPAWGSAADGSNAFAVAPERTKDGHALLLANPHMSFEEIYEAHLRSDEGLHLSGANSYGRGALPIFGANDRVAWSLTVNRPDVADTWRVRFEPADNRPGRAYRYGGETRRATERAVNVSVLGAGGALETRELRWMVTHHGPVLLEGEDEGYAVAVAGLERGGGLNCAYNMARANSVDELMAALEDGGLLFHNVVAADTGGDIGYVYNALVPRRSRDVDWSRPVDGNDPELEWSGYHDWSELPSIRNPECGWLQNCNSRPETTVSNGAHLVVGSGGNLIGSDQDDGRVAMAHALLGRSEPFDFADWCGLPFDRRAHRAKDWIRAIEMEVAAMGQRDSARVRDLVAPMAVLREWDHIVRADSVASTLFLLTYESMGDTQPVGSLLVSALERVLADLRRSHSTWQVAWGDLNRHQRALGDPARHSDQRQSWPVEGGHGAVGLAWTFLSSPGPGTVRRYGYHGNSYVAAIELSAKPRMRTIVPFGASRDPQSQHFQDQAPLFARGELKEAWLSPADVRAHAQRSYSPRRR